MKKYVALLILPLLLAVSSMHVVNAQGGYYISEEDYQLEEARQDALQSQRDAADYELEAKVASVEEQEAKEKAEADEANKQLLINVLIGVGVLVLIFFISHSWQQHSMNSRSKR